MFGGRRGVNESAANLSCYGSHRTYFQSRCLNRALFAARPISSVTPIFEQDLRGPNGKPQGECGLGKSCALHAISLIFEQDLDGLSGLE